MRSINSCTLTATDPVVKRAHVLGDFMHLCHWSQFDTIRNINKRYPDLVLASFSELTVTGAGSMYPLDLHKLLDYFASVYNQDTVDEFDSYLDSDTISANATTNIVVFRDEVLKKIKQLDKNKSPGADRFLAFFVQRILVASSLTFLKDALRLKYNHWKHVASNCI
ncbi:hypothetical protein EVAR_22593_1 [Eumeta japonica]|uniref:Uncharacterized protein n=1 Tax=Eumeta variegata TaxID=151549 RepID=A0A4C1U873_EUMVA|nr:hypothetical protein EVAR_22593_1 [Eumeta japonica]